MDAPLAIEALIDASYGDLHRSPLFEAVAIPEREAIGDQSYVSLPSLGISMVLPDNETVKAIQLHSEGHEDFSQYRGEVPGGLAFDMDRATVRAKLGPPERSGEKGTVAPLGMMPAWDSFTLSNSRLHVEYQMGDDGVRMFSLMPKRVE